MLAQKRIDWVSEIKLLYLYGDTECKKKVYKKYEARSGDLFIEN